MAYYESIHVTPKNKRCYNANELLTLLRGQYIMVNDTEDWRFLDSIHNVVKLIIGEHNLWSLLSLVGKFSDLKTAFLFEQANILTLVNLAAEFKWPFATFHLPLLWISFICFWGINKRQIPWGKFSLATRRATCRYRHTWYCFQRKWRWSHRILSYPSTSKLLLTTKPVRKDTPHYL